MKRYFHLLDTNSKICRLYRLVCVYCIYLVCTVVWNQRQKKRGVDLGGELLHTNALIGMNKVVLNEQFEMAGRGGVRRPLHFCRTIVFTPG